MIEQREDCKFFKQHFVYNEKLKRMEKVGHWHCLESRVKSCAGCENYFKIDRKKVDIKYSILCQLSMLSLELKAIKKLVIEAKLDKNCKKEGKNM